MIEVVIVLIILIILSSCGSNRKRSRGIITLPTSGTTTTDPEMNSLIDQIMDKDELPKNRKRTTLNIYKGSENEE